MWISREEKVLGGERHIILQSLMTIKRAVYWNGRGTIYSDMGIKLSGWNIGYFEGKISGKRKIRT